MNRFFDTSALIKLYHQEPGTNNLINSLHRYAENMILGFSGLLTKIFRIVITDSDKRNF
jgi:hypothetical protein